MEYSMLYPKNTATRRAVSLDGMWKFKFDKEEQGEREGWTKGLPEPILMPVPASFADFFTDKESREYTGDFWYEMDVIVPMEWNKQQVDLRFAAATHRAVVYVNGVEVARHEGGFLPFVARITKHVKWNEKNKIVVKLNNELSYTSLPAGKTITLSDGRKMSKPFFDFYNYSGLQRSVVMMALPEESIKDFSVEHKICGEDAEVKYSVECTDNGNIEVELYDKEKNLAAKSSGSNGVLQVKNARLWQVRNAYLYDMVIRLKDGEEVKDEYCQPIGIRTVEIKGTEILVNGKSVYLKGFGKHEDSDIVGRGFNIGMMKRDFELMKWIGANSFRTAHYPYSEEIYQMADEEGFLVIDEVAAVGFMESLMNFMDASSGKVTNFFDKETIPELKKNHLKAIEELITRDKNYACVIAWSLLNEPDTLTESANEYFKDLFELAHKLDPQKRPRTFALLMNSRPENCKCYHYCDFISLNRYYGWYVKGGNEIVDSEKAFREEMDDWEKLNLNIPFIFTEYGADTNVAEHKLPSVMWSQEYQTEYLDMCHSVFDSYDFVKGEQVWNFADFQTTEGIMRMNGNKKGIFTRQRQPKAAAYYYKKRWDEMPLNYKANR